MILLLDADNRSLNFAIADETTDETVRKVSIAVSKDKSADEISFLLKGMMGDALEDIKGAIVSSVVPRENDIIKRVIEMTTGLSPRFVGHGLKTGLNIKIDHHEQLGSDIVCCAVGAAADAKSSSSDPFPITVIDVKYATTVTAVNANGELCGVAIIPGMSLSADALSEKAGFLPDISLKTPDILLGKNTRDSMNCGTVLSHAYAIDGFITDINERIFEGKEAKVYITGCSAELIYPLLKSKARLVPDLSFEGLKRIYRQNTR